MAYNDTQHSFSGADINVMFIIGGLSKNRINPAKPFKHSAEIQTITISSTTSVLPVRRLGEKQPKAFNKGARTFAGSMIFTVIDQDPFMELFALDYINSVSSSSQWHIDEMPPFDILIQAVNESGRSGMQLISGVTLTNYGTTYSVDDIFTESSYSYVAEHVSPFIENTHYSQFLKAMRRVDFSRPSTPDEKIANGIMNLRVLRGRQRLDKHIPSGLLSYEKRFPHLSTKTNLAIEALFNEFEAEPGLGKVYTGPYTSDLYHQDLYDLKQ